MRAREFLGEVGPAVKNIVAPAVLGRPKPEDVTHAYRTMRPAELEHAQSTGYFTAKNPDLENRKWWTGHTANPRGIGPLNTAPYSSDIARVPIDKVPSDTAVNANHAEFWNRETGKWAPVVADNATKEITKTAVPAVAAKTIGKVVGKALPLVGTGLSIKDAYDRWQSGDRTGAVISALAGAGYLVPGPAGWVLGGGLDAANLARDMSK